MIKQLVDLADSLDKKGYHKLATEVDGIIKKIATEYYEECSHRTPGEDRRHGYYDTSRYSECPRCKKDKELKSELGHHYHTHRGDKSDK